MTSLLLYRVMNKPRSHARDLSLAFCFSFLSFGAIILLSSSHASTRSSPAQNSILYGATTLCICSCFVWRSLSASLATVRPPFSSLSICCQCRFGRGTVHPYTFVFCILLVNSSTSVISFLRSHLGEWL